MADAEEGVRAQDAQQHDAGLGARPPPQAGPKNRGLLLQSGRVAGERGRADVLERAQRDHQHVVGRDGAGGGGRARDGVPASDIGDDAAFGETERVGLLSGFGPVGLARRV